VSKAAGGSPASSCRYGPAARTAARLLQPHPHPPRARPSDRRDGPQAGDPVLVHAHPRRGPRPPTTVADQEELRRLELTAGAPKYAPSVRGISSTNDAIRKAERRLAEQAETSYKRLVIDQRAGAPARKTRKAAGRACERAWEPAVQECRRDQPSLRQRTCHVRPVRGQAAVLSRLARSAGCLARGGRAWPPRCRA
jgi:hypothetical protein